MPVFKVGYGGVDYINVTIEYIPPYVLFIYVRNNTGSTDKGTPE